MSKTFRKIVLNSRPEGTPKAKNFKILTDEIGDPAQGQVLIETRYVSVDPYMRGRMNDRKSYVPPYELGEVISGGAMGKVTKSASSEINEGDWVIGNWGWQEMSLSDANAVRKIDDDTHSITAYMSILGMTGLTAYFGLLDIGKPKEGETVAVSGAAGAVGSVVGQLAKLKGAKVVGIAGSETKIKYLTNELGFDAAINYKEENDIYEAIGDACPDGVDIYFDNVGGAISDAVMAHINLNARIVICGQISLYNLEKPDVGPRIQPQILINRAMMKGFIVGDYRDEFSTALKELSKWLSDNKLSYRETITNGFENIPKAFLGLFKGENIGKQLVEL